jgi:hypothetical protein
MWRKMESYQIEQAQKWAPQEVGSGELTTGSWGKLIEDRGGDKPKAVGIRRAPRVGARAVVLYFQIGMVKVIII